MRTLYAYPDLLRRQLYHVYSDALQRAISGLRPEADVAACKLAEIGEQVEGSTDS